MNIMVCLISDQHVPNLLTVHKVMPDLLILVVTPDMKRRNVATNFMNALDLGGLSDLLKKDRHEMVSLEDENSIPTALKLFQDIVTKYPEAEWFINITGGTKPMSIAAFEFFRDRSNCTMLYVPINDQTKALKFIRKKQLSPFDEENAAIRLKALSITNEIELLDHKVSIGQFLAGYGFELVKEVSVVELNEKLALDWFETSVYLVKNHDNKDVIDFLRRFTEISHKRNGRENGLNLQDSDKMDLSDDGLINKLTQIFPLFSVKDSKITGSLEANEVEFLTGGWLEVFIWALLNKHSNDLGIREVHLDLEIGSKSSIEPRPKNEWDVTFMQDQSLCFIECKTGNQKKKKGEDILYKVEAIKKHLGALRVKSYLATTSPIVIDKKTGEIYKHLKTRSALYNCKIIEGENLQKIAEMQLDPGKSSSELVELIASTFDLGRKVSS